MSKAVVMLSGGQDSVTCALLAKKYHEEVYAISFNYGQKHLIEMVAAHDCAEFLNIPIHTVNIDDNVLLSSSPLTTQNEVELYQNASELPQGIANTFVPCRNALFLTIACNYAISLDINIIYTGVNQTDYSGYPDCRRDFIDSMEDTLSLANYGEKDMIQIITPLINLTKSQTVEKGRELLNSEDFYRLFSMTHTCYNGVKGGCGKCAACLLRDKGFIEAGIDDPIWQYRNEKVCIN